MHCDLPNVSLFGFIFLKKFPKVYLLLKTVFMLNLSPVLLNFSEVSRMYGMDIIRTDWLSFFAFVLCLGFLFITIHVLTSMRVGCQLHQIQLCPVVLIVAQFVVYQLNSESLLTSLAQDHQKCRKVSSYVTRSPIYCSC